MRQVKNGRIWTASGPAVAIYVQGERMGGWFGKLPDWQMAIAWLVTVAIGMLVYFYPISRLLDQLSE